MKVNYPNHVQNQVLSFGSIMGFYLSLAQGYFEVASDVVLNSKKDNELSINSYKLNDALIRLWFSWYAYVFISYDYVVFWLTLWDILCLYVVFILTTYRTNTYRLHVFQVGSLQDQLAWTREFQGFYKEKNWWVIITVWTNLYFPLRLSLCLRFCAFCVQMLFVHVKVRWFLRQ